MMNEELGNIVDKDEEERQILKDCKDFLTKSSQRFLDDINEQERALEIAGGKFWDEDTKKRWATVDDKGKEIIPVIPYNNIDTQVNAIASPFSRSPFHTNLIDKETYKELQDSIVKVEASNDVKMVYQKAHTRGVKCGAGYIVVGTNLDKGGNTIPTVEFIPKQRMIALDPDCIKASGEDAEMGAIVTYVGIKKARREYGEEIVPEEYVPSEGFMHFDSDNAWGDKKDKVRKILFFVRKSEKFIDPTDNSEHSVDYVVMYTIIGDRVLPVLDKRTNQMVLGVRIDSPIIPIVRFAGYSDYKKDVDGECYTGYVQKMSANIEEMSLARTMRGVRMRRCSNVRVVAGKSAVNGCEGYFQDFEKGCSEMLVFDDSNGAAPPNIINDTFQTADISAVLQDGRQIIQDCSGVNLAGIDTTQRTAYEVMQQQVNSESNVQDLYMNAESACNALSRIIIGIFNKGMVPEFTLEGGPSVITAQMKERAEIQAVAEMMAPEHKELAAIRLAKTIKSDAAKGLAQDIMANCGLQLTDSQEIGAVMNAAKKLKDMLDETTQKYEEALDNMKSIEEENKQLNIQLSNMKDQQRLDYMKFIAQMNKDQAQLQVENADAARKLDQEDKRLELEAQKVTGENFVKAAKIQKDAYDVASMLEAR